VYTADGVSSSFQVASVDVVTDMKALTIGNNIFIRTLGRNSVNDGGGWTYYWDAESTDADDGGMTIQPASLPAAGRWKGVFPDNRELNLKVYDAVCDGTTNDVNAIIACDAYCNTNGVIMAVDDNTYFATDPTIESRVRLLPGAQLRWGNFQPTIDILIDNDDKTQHFNCAVAYIPVTKFNNVFPEWFGETVTSYPIATAAAAAADCASVVIIKNISASIIAATTSLISPEIYSTYPVLYTAAIVGCVDDSATIVYGIIGRIVFVQFNLDEISDANDLTIALPVAVYPNTNYASSFICEVESNGVAGIGYGIIDGSGTVVAIGFNSFYGDWTTTGSKKAKGSFWYTQ